MPTWTDPRDSESWKRSRAPLNASGGYSNDRLVDAFERLVETQRAKINMHRNIVIAWLSGTAVGIFLGLLMHGAI